MKKFKILADSMDWFECNQRRISTMNFSDDVEKRCIKLKVKRRL